MNENINQKIAKIPFWILYLVSGSIIVFDMIYTYFFLTNNPNASEGNPINAYLVGIFGLNYFLVMIPVVLLLLYGAAKLADGIIRKYYKKSQIKGDNYVVIAVILIILPNFLFNEVFALLFGTKPLLSFQGALLCGLFLAIIYVVITEIIDSNTIKITK